MNDQKVQIPLHKAKAICYGIKDSFNIIHLCGMNPIFKKKLLNNLREISRVLVDSVKLAENKNAPINTNNIKSII